MYLWSDFAFLSDLVGGLNALGMKDPVKAGESNKCTGKDHGIDGKMATGCDPDVIEKTGAQGLIVRPLASS